MTQIKKKIAKNSGRESFSIRKIQKNIAADTHLGCQGTINGYHGENNATRFNCALFFSWCDSRNDSIFFCCSPLWYVRRKNGKRRWRGKKHHLQCKYNKGVHLNLIWTFIRIFSRSFVRFATGNWIISWMFFIYYRQFLAARWLARSRAREKAMLFRSWFLCRWVGMIDICCVCCVVCKQDTFCLPSFIFALDVCACVFSLAPQLIFVVIFGEISFIFSIFKQESSIKVPYSCYYKYKHI